MVEILRDGVGAAARARVDRARIEASTEEEIAGQLAEDNAEAVRDAAA